MGFVHFGKSLRGMTAKEPVPAREVILPTLGLSAILRIPGDAKALIVLVHASGTSGANPRHRAVAQSFNHSSFATLRLDLVSGAESDDHQVRGNVTALAERLCGAVEWIGSERQLRDLPLGFFAGNSGAAAAFAVASRLSGRLGAIVSRGGRPDLAGDSLENVNVPSLLIVGGQDAPVIATNEQALARLKGTKEMEIIAGASHFFTEPGALTAVAKRATQWFDLHLMKSTAGKPELAHCGD